MRRILIIEDEANLRLLYRLELEFEGYEIVAVGSGNEALEILAHEKMDAVVLDFLLPDFGGLQLLDDILSRQRYVPIIINTGYDQLRNDFHCGVAEAFVVKSSDLSELKGALAQAISSRKIVTLPAKSATAHLKAKEREPHSERFNRVGKNKMA
jgi:DNA-binding NtrC family response regulator